MKDNIEISVLVPTRGRVNHQLPSTVTNMVRDTIHNVQEKTSSRQTVEIIIGYDHDDFETKEYLQKEDYLSEISDVWGNDAVDIIKCEFPYTKSKDFLNKRYQMLGKIARATKWIWISNDDTRILTNNWDDVLRNQAPSQKAVISQGVINDIPGYECNGRQPHDYIAISPILTRDIFDLTQDIMMNGLDEWFAEVCNRTGVLRDMSYNLDIAHLEWGSRAPGTNTFDKAGANCSTRLRKFRKTPEWEASLQEAVLRIKGA